MWRRAFSHQRTTIRRMKAILKRDYPLPLRYQLTWFERVFMISVLLVEMLSVCHTCKCFLFYDRDLKGRDKRLDFQRSHFVEVYCLAMLLLLLAALFFGKDHICTWLLVGTAAYAICEMVVATIKVQFVNVYSRTDMPRSPNRSILLLVLGYFQVMTGFAVLYVSLGGITQQSSKALLTEPGKAFYFSCVTMTTLGYGDFYPSETVGYVLATVHVIISVLLVIIMFARFLSLPSGAWGNRQRFRAEVAVPRRKRLPARSPYDEVSRRKR
jgi:hypothetical protein